MNLNPVGSTPNIGQIPAQTHSSTSKSPVVEIATQALKGNENKAKSTLGHRFVTWLKSVGAAIRRLFSCCVAKGGRSPTPSTPNLHSRTSTSDSLPPLVPVTPDSSIPNPPPPPGSNPPPPSGNPPPPPPPPPANGTPGGRIRTADSTSNQPSPAPSPAVKKGHQKNDSAALLNSSQDLQKKIAEQRKKLEEQERNQPKESSPAAAQTPPPRSNSAPVTPAAPKKQAIPAPSSQKKPAPAMKKAPIAFDPKQVTTAVLKKSPRATPVNTQTSQENMDPLLAARLEAQKAKAE